MLVDESRDGVNAKLEKWRNALESKGFKISHTKTKYMNCNFNGHIKRAETTMRIKDHEIPQSDSLSYLSSIISKDRKIVEDIKHKIKAG